MSSNSSVLGEKCTLHVTESVRGSHSHHLSEQETNARALCGDLTMSTSIPISGWGHKGHLQERYCNDCFEIASKT
jgi:hypothetical protein